MIDQYINKIINADCLDILRTLPDKCIDLVLTDPPYGTTNCKWDSVVSFDNLWRELKRVRKDNCAILIFGQEPFSSYLRLSNIAEYKYDWKYQKVLPTGYLNAKKQPMRCYEDVCVFYGKQPVYNPQKTTGHKNKKTHSVYSKENDGSRVYGKEKRDIYYNSSERYPVDIQVFNNGVQKDKIHPTQKPVSLFEYLILTYSNENDIVLDCFSGSGTMAVACHNLHRRFICIEKDPEYWQASVERLENVQRQLLLF